MCRRASPCSGLQRSCPAWASAPVPCFTSIFCRVRHVWHPTCCLLGAVGGVCAWRTWTRASVASSKHEAATATASGCMLARAEQGPSRHGLRSSADERQAANCSDMRIFLRTPVESAIVAPAHVRRHAPGIARAFAPTSSRAARHVRLPDPQRRGRRRPARVREVRRGAGCASCRARRHRRASSTSCARSRRCASRAGRSTWRARRPCNSSTRRSAPTAAS